MTPRRTTLTALLIVLLATACGGSKAAVAGSADDVGKVLERIRAKADLAAEGGAFVAGRQVPPAPALREPTRSRSQSLLRTHVGDLDFETAERVRKEACRIRDAALLLLQGGQDSRQAVAQAAKNAQGQLEDSAEQRAVALASDLTEAAISTFVEDNFATFAVCAI